MTDWAGFAFIDHVPSVSSVTLRRPYELILEDGSIGKEEGEMLHGQELVIRGHYESEEGEAWLVAILEDAYVMNRILAGPEECQSIIPEEATRDAIRLVVLGGPAEAEPGFGGLFLDPDDNSIVYVYMLDPSLQQEAEAAAEKGLRQLNFFLIMYDNSNIGIKGPAITYCHKVQSTVQSTKISDSSCTLQVCSQRIGMLCPSISN
jgi:hypothetical protein